MVRREIKNFNLKTEGADVACTLPCSVKSALLAAGEKVENIGSSVRFDTNIYVDDISLAMKNFYLRLRGILKPAKVYIGDKIICCPDGITPVYNVDVVGLLVKGDNTLSVRFDEENAGDLTYAGISATVEILRFSSAIIDRVSLVQTHEEGTVTLGIKLDLIGDPGGVRAVATLVSSTGQIYYAGLTRGQGSIVVHDPLYWWPKGLGVQNLYRLTVNLYGESDVEDTAEMRIGLRTAQGLNDNANLFINGCEMLPMGAVYLADGDPDFTSADKKAEAFVTAAAMSGYNCLVIPLESPTPSEKFYEFCDIHGIAVIEEHSSLDSSAIDALHRRGHHASLCLLDLIGNQASSNDKKRLSELLPNLSVINIESAPEYIATHALPSMKTIRAVINENERSLFSREIEAIAEEGSIKEMLMSVADRYPYPADLSKFSYASALASAHKVGEVIKNSRMSRGNNGRAVFYRLNDSELIISPSAIDYRVRWKPLQYYTSRHFAPIGLYAEVKGGRVVFSASSQRRLDLFGSLEYRVADASNYTIYKGSEPVELTAMSSREILSTDLSSVIRGHENEYYLEYYIKEGSSIISHKTMLFVPEKHFDFKKPLIKSVITGQDRRFSLTISSNVFVKDLEIDFDGVDAVFETNYIDLTTDAPVKIEFTVIGGLQTTYHLKDVMMLRSVVDLTK